MAFGGSFFGGGGFGGEGLIGGFDFAVLGRCRCGEELVVVGGVGLEAGEGGFLSFALKLDEFAAEREGAFESMSPGSQ